MKKPFAKTATQHKPAPYYDDACAQLLHEHRMLEKSWPKPWGNMDSSFSNDWNNFLEHRFAIERPYPNFTKFGYAEFRELFMQNRVLFVKDDVREESANSIAMLQVGHKSILSKPHMHRNIQKEDMLCIATFCRFDVADYAYALFTSLPSDDLKPPKTFTYRDLESGTKKTGYIPLERAFLDKYLTERENAKADIQEVLANALKGAWRVPNFPPKPGDNL
jgi:hypothetical protein